MSLSHIFTHPSEDIIQHKKAKHIPRSIYFLVARETTVWATAVLEKSARGASTGNAGAKGMSTVDSIDPVHYGTGHLGSRSMFGAAEWVTTLPNPRGRGAGVTSRGSDLNQRLSVSPWCRGYICPDYTSPTPPPIYRGASCMEHP